VSKLVLFIHVFRTGGSSIGKVLGDTLGIRYARIHTEQIVKDAGHHQRPKDVVMGHFPYGIHHFIGRPCVYVTMLRDPVDRSISGYFSPGRGKDRKAGDYIEAVRRGHGYEARPNAQLRLLCGWPPDVIRGGFYNFINRDVDESHLEQAKRNLDTFRYVGLHEHWEHDLRAIQQMFGWPKGKTKGVRENASRKRPSVSELP